MKEAMPMNLERGYMIAGKIAECHQAATRLFGNRFAEKTKPIRVAMQELMDKSGCDEVSAGLAVMRMLKEKGNLDAMGIMMVSAVTYAMCEEKPK